MEIIGNAGFLMDWAKAKEKQTDYMRAGFSSSDKYSAYFYGSYTLEVDKLPTMTTLNFMIGTKSNPGYYNIQAFNYSTNRWDQIAQGRGLDARIPPAYRGDPYRSVDLGSEYINNNKILIQGTLSGEDGIDISLGSMIFKAEMIYQIPDTLDPVIEDPQPEPQDPLAPSYEESAQTPKETTPQGVDLSPLLLGFILTQLK